MELEHVREQWMTGYHHVVSEQDCKGLTGNVLLRHGNGVT
jgi:hypothetical protein